jgi:hypothetical protein
MLAQSERIIAIFDWKGDRVAILDVPLSFADQHLDWLLVPGRSWAVRAAQGAWAEFNHGELPGVLAQQAERERRWHPFARMPCS